MIVPVTCVSKLEFEAGVAGSMAQVQFYEFTFEAHPLWGKQYIGFGGHEKILLKAPEGCFVVGKKYKLTIEAVGE